MKIAWIIFFVIVIILLIGFIFYRIKHRKKNDEEKFPYKGNNNAIIYNNINRSELEGRIGESEVSWKLGFATVGEQYKIDNLILKDKNNNTSQIDHILINKYGLWVIETKNIKGYIYGNENQKYWTQVLAFGHERHQFYNPIKQNHTHIYKLKEKIGINAPIHSIICFVSADKINVDSEEVCNIDELLKIINRGDEIVLSELEMVEYYHKLIDIKNEEITLEEHLDNISERESWKRNNLCPMCGGELKLKKGKYGDFWGCSNYPKCTYTNKLEE